MPFLPPNRALFGCDVYATKRSASSSRNQCVIWFQHGNRRAISPPGKDGCFSDGGMTPESSSGYRLGVGRG